ncbi:PilZ domain-containing protein [Bacillus tianshenii]|nr:PilZ domain-containing protein [Bacillus tianshenii]
MDYIKLVKDNKLYTGALYLFEGELMKIIVKNPQEYKAGDKITCLYTGVRFESKVLKVKDNHLFILVPQFYEQFPNEKRKHPRLKVDFPAHLHVSQEAESNGEKTDARVLDISRKGLGIATTHPIRKERMYLLYIEENVLKLCAEIVIRNESTSDSMYRYGCEIHDINEENEFVLRKFILSEQLATNMAKEID